MIILGAGMSGCIAAILNGAATILEASETPPLNHNAVLRFRTDSISKVTGIDFKKVLVHKGIFYNGQMYRNCDMRLANKYSRKVANKIVSRSIWNLDSGYRYVAPSNFHELMINMIGDRILYGHQVSSISSDSIIAVTNQGSIEMPRKGTPVISTMPMPVMAGVAGMPLDKTLFQRQPITAVRAKVANCDVNQTVYYPGEDTRLYRVTITGGDLIMEFVGGDGESFDVSNDILEQVMPAFGLEFDEIGDPVFSIQKYGKIAPVEDGIRKSFMFDLTRQLGVYSLGRFAVWRNILLDDVFDDVLAIRKMIGQSIYDVQRMYC